MPSLVVEYVSRQPALNIGYIVIIYVFFIPFTIEPEYYWMISLYLDQDGGMTFHEPEIDPRFVGSKPACNGKEINQYV